MRRKQRGFWAGIVLAFVALAAVTQVGVYLRAEKLRSRQDESNETQILASETSRQRDAAPLPSSAATSATSRYSTDSVAAYEALWPLVRERKGAIMELSPYFDDPNPPQEARVWIDRVITANQDLLARIREVTSMEGPMCEADDSLETDFTFDERCRLGAYAVRLLRLDILAGSRKGDYATVAADLLAGLRLGEALAQVPLGTAQCVSDDYALSILALVAALDNRGHFPDESVAMLVAELREVRTMRRLDVLLDFYLREWLKTVEMARGYSGNSKSLVDRISKFPLTRPWMDVFFWGRQKDLIVQAFDLPAQLVGKDYSETLKELETREKLVPIYCSYAKGSLEALRMALVSFASLQAKSDMAALALLLDQHQAKNGAYPDSLDVLCSALGYQPRDPYNDAAYHFQNEGDTFRLWSVGADQRDEGGDRLSDCVWGLELPWVHDPLLGM